MPCHGLAPESDFAKESQRDEFLRFEGFRKALKSYHAATSDADKARALKTLTAFLQALKGDENLDVREGPAGIPMVWKSQPEGPLLLGMLNPSLEITGRREESGSLPGFHSSAAIPIPRNAPAGEPLVVARCGYDARQGLQAHGNEAFWTSPRRDVMTKVWKMFSQKHARYRESAGRLTVAVTRGAPRLMQVLEDRNGNYEVRMDEALLELADSMDVGPFLALALGHEWNHALLSEERLGVPTDPLLEETAVNAADLLAFSRMRKTHRDLVLTALDALETKGFLTRPYRDFLSGVLPEDESKDTERPLPLPWGKDPGAFCLQAYAMAVHPEANPRHHRRMLSLLHDLPQKRSVDYKSGIQANLSPRLKGVFTTAFRQGRFLNSFLNQMEGLVLDETNRYARARDELFQRLRLSSYRKEQGAVDEEVEKRILERDIPIMAALGGPHEYRQLQRILGSAHYRMPLRIAAGKAILEMRPPSDGERLRNPFFLRAFLDYSKDLRARGITTEADAQSATNILTLLGNAGPDNNSLYMDIRSEIVAWILEAQHSMHYALASHSPEERFAEARQVFLHGEDMLKKIRDDLRAYVGEPAVTQEEWQKKIVYESAPLDPAEIHSGEEVGMELAKALAKELPLAQKAKASLLELLKDPRILRESLYLGYGFIPDEDSISKVRVRFLGQGMFKFAYLIEVETPWQTFLLVRNFIKEPASVALDKARTESPIAFSHVQDEMYRMMLASPQIFETMYWYDRKDNHVFWDEEFVPGIVLFDTRHLAGPHFLDRRPGEEFSAWKKRFLRAVRGYVALIFQAWDGSGRTNTAIDINSWNSLVNEEGGQRFIDAGFYAVGTKGFEYRNDYLDFWMWIRQNVEHMQAHYKLIAPEEVFPVAYAGVLDALGEKGGLAVLRTIEEDLKKRLPKHIAGEIIPEMQAYIAEGHLSYLPESMERPLSGDERERLRADPQRFTFEQYFAMPQTLRRESPWLWAYINQRVLMEKAGGYKNLSADDQRLADALDRLMDKIRRTPGFADSPDASTWIRNLALGMKLGPAQAARLETSVSYASALRRILKYRFASALRNHGHDPGEYLQQGDGVTDMILLADTEPGAAAHLMQRIMSDPWYWTFVVDMRFPKSAVATIQVEEEMEQFLYGLKEDGFLDGESLLEVLRRLDPPFLRMFMRSDRYHAIMREFLLKDYRRVADAYKYLIHNDPDRAAELAYFSLVEGKLGILGAAYLLDEFDAPETQEAWVESVLGRKEVQGPWNTTWHHVRREAPQAVRQVMVPRAAQFLAKYYELNPSRARVLLTRILGSINPSLRRTHSFAGVEELVDAEGHRVEELVIFLRNIPERYWLSTLRGMTLNGAAKVLSTYGLLLVSYQDRMEALRDEMRTRLEESRKILRHMDKSRNRSAYLKTKKNIVLRERFLADLESELKRTREEFERLGTFLAALEVFKPALVDSVLRTWLATPEASSGALDGWLHHAPQRAISAALFHFASKDPAALERILEIVPHMEDDASRNRIVQILRNYRNSLEYLLPAMDFGAYLPNVGSSYAESSL